MVATLILILIAVAAAAALYLWLVAWQGNITGGIGSPGAQTTVTIGGSTSVYPFDQLAVSQFEQNNSDVAVSDNQGGSGAGMIAVCSGAVDVGATSALQTVSNLQANYGCPQGGNAVPVVHHHVQRRGPDHLVCQRPRADQHEPGHSPDRLHPGRALRRSWAAGPTRSMARSLSVQPP